MRYDAEAKIEIRERERGGSGGGEGGWRGARIKDSLPSTLGASRDIPLQSSQSTNHNNPNRQSIPQASKSNTLVNTRHGPSGRFTYSQACQEEERMEE